DDRGHRLDHVANVGLLLVVEIAAALADDEVCQGRERAESEHGEDENARKDAVESLEHRRVPAAGQERLDGAGKWVRTGKLLRPRDQRLQGTGQRLRVSRVTSRAQSTNSLATGLSVRFFSVTTATGASGAGSRIGSALSAKFLALKRSTEPGTR